jgi:hypothetical protein
MSFPGGTIPGAPGSIWGGIGAGGTPCSIIARNVLYIAFREARILKRPQALNSGNELADGLIFLNQQIDYWSARGCYAYTTAFNVYTLTPGHQPHLIGPGLLAPDWAATSRPVKIISASVILPTATDVSLRIRDDAWWAAQSVKSIQSSMPTDLYYNADYPNGQLWFWPISISGYQVRLETYVLLQQFVTLDDCFIAPPAYLAAVTLTLAEELVDIWGTEMPMNLSRRATKARDALQSNNYLPPRIATADWGTSGSRRGSDFNWQTGTIPTR